MFVLMVITPPPPQLKPEIPEIPLLKMFVLMVIKKTPAQTWNPRKPTTQDICINDYTKQLKSQIPLL